MSYKGLELYFHPGGIIHHSNFLYFALLQRLPGFVFLFVSSTLRAWLSLPISHLFFVACSPCCLPISLCSRQIDIRLLVVLLSSMPPILYKNRNRGVMLVEK
jgi:hypothetical protein